MNGAGPLLPDHTGPDETDAVPTLISRPGTRADKKSGKVRMLTDLASNARQTDWASRCTFAWIRGYCGHGSYGFMLERGLSHRLRFQRRLLQSVRLSAD